MPWISSVLPLSVSWGVGFSLLVLVYCIGWTIYARRFHPLAKHPGPFLASITRLWLVVNVARGGADETQRQLHQVYGPIVRIAPNEVAIADPEAIKVIYATHTGFTKTDFYLPFRATWGRYPDAFTNLDEHQHAERRRIVNKLYSMANVLQMEESIDSCVEMLMVKFKECAAAGNPIDMATWVQWYAFDVIGQLFFSRKFGFMENAHDHEGYIRALDLVVPIIAVACAMPVYMRPFLLISGAMIPRIFKALKALKHIENASEACVAERLHLLNNEKNREDGCEDMLSCFLNIMKNRGAEKDFGLTEVKMEVYGAFIAGSDTTAAAIISVLYHLMRTPLAYDKLTAEIDEAVAAGFLSVPTIQYHEAVGLSYLVACCKEGMRMHPSVGQTLPRYVPAGGCMIAGSWFPGGVRVGVNAAVAHRDRSIFGEDADEFLPERWFRKDAVRMGRFMFQFGGGSRTCIGKNISLCEMYKLVPQLLRSFHLELSNPTREWNTRNYWFNKPCQVHTVLRCRELPVH